MHYNYRGVNDAFKKMTERLALGTVPTTTTDSRVGKVLQVVEPWTFTYSHPTERVLFNKARDCNPFFHLYEALWMLAGRNDVASLVYYNKQMAQYSDNGETFNGAYGHRWRKPWDQLKTICIHLKKLSGSRRAVLQIWDKERDLIVVEKSKDIPCNIYAEFSVLNDALEMTVCNRSNDFLWGMLGANFVHFTILQEYMAARIGVRVGRYHHFTNNLHIYTNKWKPADLMSDDTPDYYTEGKMKRIPLVKDPKMFDKELPEMVDNKDWTRNWKEPFFQKVASPMFWVFELYKQRKYTMALRAIDCVKADDWKIVAFNWILRRKWMREQRNEKTSSDKD